MKYKIYLNELDDTSKKLVRYSKNDIKNKINEIKDIGMSLNWKGPAHDNFMNGFNKKIENLNLLNDKICLLGEYLDNCYSSYNETSNKVNNSWEEYLSEMKVRK